MRVFLILLLGCLLLDPPSAAAGEQTTEATLNVLYTNAAWKVDADVTKAMRHADLVRLQEVSQPRSKEGVRRALRSHRHWRSVFVGRSAIPILWDDRVWQQAGDAHRMFLAPCCPGPSRWLLWVPLRNRATGQVVTVANTHAVSRYCSDHSVNLRDRLARQHWTKVRDWTERQPKSRTILLGGDFNCRLQNRAHWWYPGPMLDQDYRFDRTRGIDRLITSRTPGHPTTVRRWSLPAYSDHRLHLRTIGLGN